MTKKQEVMAIITGLKPMEVYDIATAVVEYTHIVAKENNIRTIRNYTSKFVEYMEGTEELKIYRQVEKFKAKEE